MTTHNPVEGIPIQPQVSTSEQSMGRFRKFFRSTGGRITVGAVGVTAAAGAVAYALAPKGGEAAPAPVTTNSAEPFPTEEPTSEATPKPEATPENAFPGTVNYDAFVDWETKSEEERDAVCAEFFNTNLPNSAPVGRESTGPEIVAWWGERAVLVNTLNMDKSDERNREVALDLADCLTSVRSESADGRTELINGLDTYYAPMPGAEPDMIEHLIEVTRYSDGVFPAQGKLGNAYEAIRIEGKVNTYGNPLKEEVYALNQSTVFPGFKLVNRSEAGLGLEGSNEFNPPIVLDSARTNEPW